MIAIFYMAMRCFFAIPIVVKVGGYDKKYGRWQQKKLVLMPDLFS